MTTDEQITKLKNEARALCARLAAVDDELREHLPIVNRCFEEAKRLNWRMDAITGELRGLGVGTDDWEQWAEDQADDGDD